MGVITKKWGPLAWTYIHNMSNVLDNLYKKKQYRFWYNIIQCLPCIFCRQSAFLFLQQKFKSVKSNKEFAYLLHENVNMKLMYQELQNITESELHNFVVKWSTYQPSFENIKYIQLDNIVFIESFIYLSYFIICDYTEKRGNDIQSFFDYNYTILNKISPCIYVNSGTVNCQLEHSKFKYVFQLQKQLCSKYNIDIDQNYRQYMNYVKKYIV
jgi:hypothetical protein